MMTAAMAKSRKGRVKNATNSAGKQQIPSYLHLNFDSLSPFTLNCETPSMNSETRNSHTHKTQDWDYLQRIFASFAPLTLNREMPSINSETKKTDG